MDYHTHFYRHAVKFLHGVPQFTISDKFESGQIIFWKGQLYMI